MLIRLVTLLGIALLLVSPVAHAHSLDETLNLSLAGSGSGTVTGSATVTIGGSTQTYTASCPPTCSVTAPLPVGTSIAVALHASPASGSTFGGWSGGCGGSSPDCTVTVSSATASVTATFNVAAPAQFTVTTSVAGGSGSVAGGGTYGAGSAATITAQASSGYRFDHWTGCPSSATANPCVFTVTAAATVAATFAATGAPPPPPPPPPPTPAPTPSYTLTVTRTGSGSGSVTSSAGGISCGNACSASFLSGQSVTLTPSPDSSSFFAGWNGGACIGFSACVVRISAATTVIAAFLRPDVQVATANLQAHWRGSHAQNAAVVLSGTSNVAGTATLTLTRSGQQPITLPVPVTSGTFSATLPLAQTNLLPGQYQVSLAGTINGATLTPVTVNAVLAPPALGVVQSATFTLSQKGNPVTRVPLSARQLWIHLHFASMPQGHPHLTVQWTKPSGTPATPHPTPVRAAATIVTGIAVNSGKINRGIWTIVLRNRGTIVYQTNIRTT